jgi:hypothetical protein
MCGFFGYFVDFLVIFVDFLVIFCGFVGYFCVLMSPWSERRDTNTNTCVHLLYHWCCVLVSGT